MQGHEAVLAELGVPQHQHAVGAVEVILVESDGFTNANATDREQADQRLIGGRPQSWKEAARRVHQGSDLSVGVQVRSGPIRSRSHQSPWGDLHGRVDAVQVGREAAHHADADRHPVRRGSPRQGRPGQGRVGGDGGDPLVLEVVEELAEQPPRAGQLESDGPAQAEVIIQRLSQPRSHAHLSALGHGRPSPRRPSRSTFA